MGFQGSLEAPGEWRLTGHHGAPWFGAYGVAIPNPAGEDSPEIMEA
jgi:hypothetical protein